VNRWMRRTAGGEVAMFHVDFWSDAAANRRNPRIQLLLMTFRIANRMRRPLASPPRLTSYPAGVVYRFLSEWVFGVEIPWRTQVGARLTIYHGYGLVINDSSIIGNDVTLRHGVTIGSVNAGGACPIIEDGVEVGANASILGGITVGTGARIGAGAVVLTNVPPHATAVGVPARILE
jgi:putative colanic acid biosynthesis acetyltransferase WcaB